MPKPLALAVLLSTSLAAQTGGTLGIFTHAGDVGNPAVKGTATATIRFLGQGAEHRKAGFVVRQSLDPDATYADAIVHGNGMPSLQWRARKGEDTNTFDTPVQGPGVFKIKMVRNGVRIFLYAIKGEGEPSEIVHTEVTFQPQMPVLLGLAVCSHDASKSETVVFSDVAITTP